MLTLLVNLTVPKEATIFQGLLYFCTLAFLMRLCFEVDYVSRATTYCVITVFDLLEILQEIYDDTEIEIELVAIINVSSWHASSRKLTLHLNTCFII